MRTLGLLGCVLVLSASLAFLWADPAPPTATSLRFEVTVAKGLLARPTDGRVLVVLGKKADPEPRASIGSTGMHVPPVLGVDARGLAAGGKVTLDQTSAIYPLSHLTSLPPGEYVAQAVFDHNPDLRLHDAPGNLFSEPKGVRLDPGRGGTVTLEMTRKEQEEKLPSGDEYVRYVKLRSEVLSRFWGRPMYLRAGVVLPVGHATEKDRRYPLWVHIDGFGSRYTGAGERMREGEEFRKAWLARGAPRFIFLHLDGAGPLGDPYQVNSANNGPYGEAVTQELIPFVEKTYRGIGKGYARTLAGASTGGWVSLALQVFYPDFFNGAWAHCPDPVDFRAFELINLYKDDNAYINSHGFERPAARDLQGDTEFTVRNEVHREVVLGRGNRWELSGKDWGSWNAAFGPRGADGLPVPLFDGRSGKIDARVLEHWKRYDLRLVLAKDWAVLAPRLRGKLHIWVGDADEYFLNNAVHLLDGFLQKAKPDAAARITFAPGKGHFWRGRTEAQTLREMAEAVERARPTP